MEKAIVLISTHSGRAHPKETEERIKNGLSDIFELSFIEIGESFKESLEAILPDLKKIHTLIVTGGDGTLRNVLNFIYNKDLDFPKIGYIPTGTLCDAGKNLGIKRSFKKAIEVIREGKTHNYDLIDFDGEICFYMCAVGAFSDIAYRTKRKDVERFGRLAYYWRSFVTAFKYKRVRISFRVNGKEYSVKTGFFMVLNGKKVGGFKVNSKGNFDDGLIEIFYTKGGLFNGLVRYFFHIGVHRISAQNVDILSIDDNVWCLDGERDERNIARISVSKKQAQFFAKI